VAVVNPSISIFTLRTSPRHGDLGYTSLEFPLDHKVFSEIKALHQLGSRIGRGESLREVLQAAADRVAPIEIDPDQQTLGFFARRGVGLASDLMSAG
jgi:hypothetical protein